MASRWLVIASVLVVSVLGGGERAAHAGKDKAPPPTKATKASKAKGTAEQAPTPAEAEAAAGSAAGDGSAEAEAEVDPLANLPHVVGPKLVDLGHGAEIDLPAGLTMFEAATAQELMRKMGNDADGVLGAILPAEGGGNWIVVIEADDVGYVSDDDADELDAASMLEQFKTGTIAQNRKRKEMGVPELFIDGWSEPPRYERFKRHLVWGLSAHGSDGKVINFFTRILGRNGFLSVNLIDDPSTIEASKVEALAILTAVRFKPGSRYEDHTSSDRDSGMGLKALVLGGAGIVVAKKTGLLIALLIFLKKGFIVVAAALGGFFKWMFGRGKKATGVTVATEPPAPGDPGAAPPAG